VNIVPLSNTTATKSIGHPDPFSHLPGCEHSDTWRRFAWLAVEEVKGCTEELLDFCRDLLHRHQWQLGKALILNSEKRILEEENTKLREAKGQL
jgi:glycogen synthase